MYILLESKSDIQAAQAKLEATICKEFTGTATRSIGWAGGREKWARLKTKEEIWYWSGNHTNGVKNPRRLNWFGVLEHDTGADIGLEINTPVGPNNNAIAGFFAMHAESGRIYLFHSGRIGGGFKGVGKEALLAWTATRLKLVDAFDKRGLPRQGIMVMPVEGLGATRSAITYLQEVVSFKAAVREGLTETAKFLAAIERQREYTRESSGRRLGKRSSIIIDYVSRHGEVVHELHAWRSRRGLAHGSKISNDDYIDLMTCCGSDIQELYEVKTSASRGDIYTAIGQLTVHCGTSHCARFLVLPRAAELKPDLAKALKRERIKIIYYELTANRAYIHT